MKESNFKQNKCWGGKRECAGRKKTCRKKVPFNRRINEDVLNILREYAQSHNMTETEALESAIILQSNVEKLKGDKIMKKALSILLSGVFTYGGNDSSTVYRVGCNRQSY